MADDNSGDGGAQLERSFGLAPLEAADALKKTRPR